MFTIFILLSFLTTKPKGMCEGIQNNPQTARILPRPGSEIPGSVTEIDMYKLTDTFYIL